MRHPSAAPAFGPDDGRAVGPPVAGPPDHSVLATLASRFGLIPLLALGSVSWQHWAVFPDGGGPAARFPVGQKPPGPRDRRLRFPYPWRDVGTNQDGGSPHEVSLPGVR